MLFRSQMFIAFPDGTTAGCTANFIWRDGGGDLYIGAAGHCFLPSDKNASANAHQSRRLDGGRAEDHPVDARRQQVGRVRRRPDPAADLDAHPVADGVDDRADRAGVRALPPEGAVEVDQVKRLRPGVDPAPGGVDRVAVPPTRAALSPHQLNDRAVLDVDRRDHLERRKGTHRRRLDRPRA